MNVASSLDDHNSRSRLERPSPYSPYRRLLLPYLAIEQWSPVYQRVQFFPELPLLRSECSLHPKAGNEIVHNGIAPTSEKNKKPFYCAMSFMHTRETPIFMSKDC
jgi:hypothetical protein